MVNDRLAVAQLGVPVSAKLEGLDLPAGNESWGLFQGKTPHFKELVELKK